MLINFSLKYNLSKTKVSILYGLILSKTYAFLLLPATKTTSTLELLSKYFIMFSTFDPLPEAKRIIFLIVVLIT